MTTLHVEPCNSHWIVRRDDSTSPMSEHVEAGEASRAAFAEARLAGDTQVLLHDRYHRSHTLAAPHRRAPRR
jgi:hypothetical protein